MTREPESEAQKKHHHCQQLPANFYAIIKLPKCFPSNVISTFDESYSSCHPEALLAKMLVSVKSAEEGESRQPENCQGNRVRSHASLLTSGSLQQEGRV
jgi:hypothetical protein